MKRNEMMPHEKVKYDQTKIHRDNEVSHSLKSKAKLYIIKYVSFMPSQFFTKTIFFYSICSCLYSSCFNKLMWVRAKAGRRFDDENFRRDIWYFGCSA